MRRIILSALGGGCLLAVVVWAWKREPDIVPIHLDEKMMRRIARLGEGLVVWERCREGAWEIWSKKLSGGTERRLIRNGAGEDYFCPKLSPDGGRLAFMCYRRGTNAYPAFGKATGSLWVRNMNTGRHRLVSAAARSYGEDRAVTWLDNSRLCFINDKGVTMEMNLEDGRLREVIHQPNERLGFLPSPDLACATGEYPAFAPLDAAGVMHHTQSFHGCQPYFTSDSRWGFWMAGAGGPVNAIHLATGESKSMLNVNDGRLDSRRNYVYFPMVSPCMRLLAFAASPDAHDHFEADYDIFIARLNPITMEMISRPVRYTGYPGCDRFPDVFRNELPLGTHFVEGETELAFKVASNNEHWQWTFSDGGKAEGREVSHTFRKPGEYWIDAVKTMEKKPRLRGYVFVDEPLPPRLLQVRREGAREVVLDFDEAVDVSHATIELDQGIAAENVRTVRDGHAVAFALSREVTKNLSIGLRNVRDRAQHPNRMPSTLTTIRGTDWPGSTQDLAFQWQDQNSPVVLANGLACRVEPKGGAFWNERGVMQLYGGWFDAPDAGPRIAEVCRANDALTVELVLTPEPHPTAGIKHGVIFTLGDARGSTAITLTQRGDVLYLCTTKPTGGKAETRERELAAIAPGRAQQVDLCLSGGRLRFFADGREMFRSPIPAEDLAAWDLPKLRFGAALDGSSAWRGKMERVLIFGRELRPAEVLQHHHAMREALSSRRPLSEWHVVARLIESSKPPALKDVQPYTEALVRNLYEIVKVEDGDGPLPQRVAVTQWCWLGGRAMPAQSLKVGDTVRLTLHESEDHHEIARLLIKDELNNGLTAARYHDICAWDLPCEQVVIDGRRAGFKRTLLKHQSPSLRLCAP